MTGSGASSNLLGNRAASAGEFAFEDAAGMHATRVGPAFSSHLKRPGPGVQVREAALVVKLTPKARDVKPCYALCCGTMLGGTGGLVEHCPSVVQQRRTWERIETQDDFT